MIVYMIIFHNEHILHAREWGWPGQGEGLTLFLQLFYYLYIIILLFTYQYVSVFSNKKHQNSLAILALYIPILIVYTDTFSTLSMSTW